MADCTGRSSGRIHPLGWTVTLAWSRGLSAVVLTEKPNIGLTTDSLAKNCPLPPLFVGDRSHGLVVRTRGFDPRGASSTLAETFSLLAF